MNKIKKNIKGISLLELMIAVAIVAILAAIAIPSYRHFIEQSNRTEVMHALMSLQLEQERYRTNNSDYASLATLWNGVTTSEEGNYAITITNITPTSYTITATIIGTSDSECASMVLAYSSGTTTKTPSACWD